jgi:hypothetical protein
MNETWRTIVSPDGKDNSLWINQQAWFSLGVFSPETTFSYQMKKPGNLLYLFVISGELTVGTETINQRDGLCIEDIENNVPIKTIKQSKILAMEIPV